MSKQTVVFDFDGVIHSYTSGWKGAEIIPDPPVEGIKEAIDDIRKAGYEVIVVSTRCSTYVGELAIRKYLTDNGIIVDDVKAHKPPAIVYIDDRAICFDGKADTLLDKIKKFEPWNKQEERFQLATIFGKEVLFTIDRVDRYKYTNYGLIRYELGHDDCGNPSYLQTDLLANFYGTILSKSNLIDLKDFGFYVINGNHGMNLSREDINITNNFVTVEEYINK